MDADKSIDRSYQVDWLLSAIITGVEKIAKDPSVAEGQKHINIILTVGGQLISGELIGHAEWIDEFAADALPSDTDGRSATDAPAQPIAENVATEPTSDDERRFIHLRRAKFFQGGSMIPAEGEGFHWRGRLAAVDGFMLGALAGKQRTSAPREIEINGVKIKIGQA